MNKSIILTIIVVSFLLKACGYDTAFYYNKEPIYSFELEYVNENAEIGSNVVQKAFIDEGILPIKFGENQYVDSYYVREKGSQIHITFYKKKNFNRLNVWILETRFKRFSETEKIKTKQLTNSLETVRHNLLMGGFFIENNRKETD